MNRRLYRCRHDRRLAGVAGGIAEYFDADPTLVRLLWVLSIFLGGTGLLLYLAMAIVVPLEPEAALEPATGAALGASAGDDQSGPGGSREPGEPGAVSDPVHGPAPEVRHRHRGKGNGTASTVIGIGLILFGALALVDTFLPAWLDNGRFVWPAFLLGTGILLVASAARRRPADA